MTRRSPRQILVCLAKSVLVIAACLVVIVAATVAGVESQCRGGVSPAMRQAGGDHWQSVLAPEERRDEINSYLTYPEWSIVYAYDDFAAVIRRGSESDFSYLGSIKGFWSGLCSIKQLVSARGPVSFGIQSMLYTIGLSFTLEMGLKGLYEETIGAATAWIRGPKRTPEDAFALAVADDYARFLRQTPWYEFPFADTLRRFWSETPMRGGNPVRKVERRVALSLEYGTKIIYAKAIKALAGLSPAPLHIRSVVIGADASDVAADARITLIRRVDGGMTVIDTPRYQELTEIIQRLAARGRDFFEIAGNRRIFVTVLSPGCRPIEGAGVRPLFAVEVQARPGSCRRGVEVEIPGLTAWLRTFGETGLELEHVYDY